MMKAIEGFTVHALGFFHAMPCHATFSRFMFLRLP